MASGLHRVLSPARLPVCAGLAYTLTDGQSSLGDPPGEVTGPFPLAYRGPYRTIGIVGTIGNTLEVRHILARLGLSALFTFRYHRM